MARRSGRHRVVGNVPTAWSMLGTGDFDGDGKGDILWQDNSGNVAVWLMDGTSLLSSAGIGNVPSPWSVPATATSTAMARPTSLARHQRQHRDLVHERHEAASTAGVGTIPTDLVGGRNRRLQWRRHERHRLARHPRQSRDLAHERRDVLSASGLGNVPTTGRSSRPATTTATARAISCGATSGNTAIWFINGVSVASTASIGEIPTAWTVQSANTE